MPASAVQKNRLQTAIVPSPSGGLNTLSSGAAASPSDCVVLWNMTAAEYGLRTRLGYQDWVTGLGEEPRTLIPYAGTKSNGSAGKLFAATTSGIWDVTASTAAPTKVIAFPGSTADSGWGIATSYTTNAGGFCVYADEAYGIYLYTESSNTWIRYAYGVGAANNIREVQGAGYPTLDPAKLAFVTAWKNMLWFVERDSARAWYLPVGQVGGDAVPFNFGNKFTRGGDLRGLWTWTFDGGTGMDDALVAISGGGDCLVYKGSDPSQPSGFYLVGSWFLGGLPTGRRLCTEIGGDLLAMTMLGLLPLSTVTAGTLVSSQQYLTLKIGNLFNQLGYSSGTVRGWGCRLHPQDNTLVVVIPQVAGQASQQLVMSTLNKSWSQYRGMPMSVAADAFQGAFYFGTPDGRVCVMKGYLDAVARDGTGGTPIDFSLITCFQDLGKPTQKRVQLLRPTFMSQGLQPSYQAVARYTWDMTEATLPPQGGAAGSTWDSGKWDVATWAGDYTPQQIVFGAQGIGPSVAIGIRGSASSRMTLVNIEVAYDEGGFL